MKRRVITGSTTAILVFMAICYFIGWETWLFVSSMTGIRSSVLYWIVFWLICFSYLIARLGAGYLPIRLTDLLKLVGSYWMAALQYLLLLLPPALAAVLLLELASVETSVSVPLIGCTVLALLIILFAWGSWNAWNPVIRTYKIVIPKKSGSLKSLRIAAASDLHLGTIVGVKHLRRLVDRLDAMKPDLILLPGDVIDDDIEPFIRFNMAETMKRLHAPYGIYAVLGNHEYYGGHIPEYVKRMEAIGIQVLMDETVKIADSFYVIGRKDRTAERAGPQGRLAVEVLLAGLDRSLPLIMMDHQPYQLDKADAAGIDVLLSGHTHRGQMAPNHLITKRLYELDWGFLKKGRLHAVVSSGFGTWGPPIRLGSRSEIIQLEITFDVSA